MAAKPKVVEVHTVEVTLGELLAKTGSVRELLAMEKSFVARLGLRIAKLSRAMDVELKPCGEAMDKLRAKHGTETEKVPGQRGAAYTIPPENTEAFVEEMDELLSEKVAITAPKIYLPPECKITPQILVSLDEFVKVKGEDDFDEPQEKVAGKIGSEATDGEAEAPAGT